HWLALGWRDIRRCPLLSLTHGAVLALFGALLFVLFSNRFWLLAGAFSGFMVVAPVLASGLYAVSRSLALRGSASFADVSATWLRFSDEHGKRDTRLVRFGLLLALAGTGWVLTSAALITLFAPHSIDRPADFLRHVLLARGDLLFEFWLLLGGVLAAPVFASSVVAMPLLLDRPVRVLDAVLTSWRVVLENPLPMAVWAALILLLTLAGFATALVGLVLVVPLLGHASWHAYRDLVVPAGGTADGVGAPPGLASVRAEQPVR
ncbi:MAG: DUF2189 domain-containing protein, partial [Burkholderiales bacterium]